MTATTLASTTMSSPVGELTIIASDAGIRAVLWPTDNPKRVPLGDVEPRDDHPVLSSAATQLGEYFDGHPQDFDLPLDPTGTEFQQSAWTALRTIPFGNL